MTDVHTDINGYAVIMYLAIFITMNLHWVYVKIKTTQSAFYILLDYK